MTIQIPFTTDGTEETYEQTYLRVIALPDGYHELGNLGLNELHRARQYWEEWYNNDAPALKLQGFMWNIEGMVVVGSSIRYCVFFRKGK